jgi:outer membrane lipoprotein-sorting protein
MKTKRTALSVATTGTAAGIVGLVLLASPSGATGAPPALPQISAQDLVQSVLAAKVPAFSGAVEVKQNLGLPLPILPSGGADGNAARVYTDGNGKARISLTRQMSETTIVADGSTLWIWDSTDKSVRKIPHGDLGQAKTQGELADPATAAAKLVSAMQQDSNITVDGTALVAGRSAYQLVLTPKPTEKTLLSEVRVAVDAETRVPLRLEVLANGQSDPAINVGFTEFRPGPQDASLFQFTVPPGATVDETKPGEQMDPKKARDLLSQFNPQTVGDGWDTVLVGKIPSGALGAVSDGARAKGAKAPDVMGLVRQFAKPVSGPFGNGWTISTKVGSILFTADGRAAIGAVPEQVLIDAMSQVK